MIVEDIRNRPSLEYQHAFDLSAQAVSHTGYPVKVFTGSRFHARELLDRLETKETALIPVGQWAAFSNIEVESIGANEKLEDASGTNLASGQAMSIVWAEPGYHTSDQTMALIAQTLVPNGRLIVISSGWSARFLPDQLGEKGQKKARPFGHHRIRKMLYQQGFVISTIYGFHGALSNVWGFASRLMSSVQRPDLADRCHYQMRAKFICRGWSSWLAPVSVTMAVRKTVQP